MIKQITYKGKTVNTSCYEDATTEEMLAAKALFFKKPTKADVLKQMYSISTGSCTNNLISRYYVRDLMANTIVKGCNWCINDIFENPELYGVFKYKIKQNDKVFTGNLADDIETAMRIGGNPFCKLPPNYPINNIDYMLSKYNVNNNWYDYSCGWGARLTGALKNKVNYFGTDPNYLLVDRLKQLASDWNNYVAAEKADLFGMSTTNKPYVDIRATGSQEFHIEWENKIGLAFSSPPYFDLEDYVVGEQSIKSNPNYTDWLNDYWQGTVNNIKKYLVCGGYFLLNIKNTKQYKMADDMSKIISDSGFDYICTEQLVNIKRITAKGTLTDLTDEPIFVFKKV